MTVADFIAKWRHHELKERSAAQEHFIDLCRLVGHATPAQADPEGRWFTFERGAAKATGGEGWADVWKKNFFGWEYKGLNRDLGAAYRQLLMYFGALENPPLLVTCDTDRLVVHTHFPNTPTTTHELTLEGLADAEQFGVLRAVFHSPHSLRPDQTVQAITEEAAAKITEIAQALRARGIAPQKVARFLDRIVFCLFAEDVGLLPERLFTKVVENTQPHPQQFRDVIGKLFTAMARGGHFGAERIAYFNGDLFDDSEVLDVTADEMRVLREVTQLDWSAIDASIFGTLFERGLDPDKRSQLGAHYTSREDIETLIEPVVMDPLRREWAGVRAEVEKLIDVPVFTKQRRDKTSQVLRAFLNRLQTVTVLDPACGSGNFLFVTLQKLKDLEKEVIVFAARFVGGLFPAVDPRQLLAIELNQYAHELAQMTVWIGYLQWVKRNGLGDPEEPILQRMTTFENRDAVLSVQSDRRVNEPEWPSAEFIVSNPPFLGVRKMRDQLGDEYVEDLFTLWDGRIPAGSDYCCYWFEKARSQLVSGKARRVGLLATQGIRSGASREVLRRIKDTGNIFFAVSDREWILDGATVHVSMVGFDDGSEPDRLLDGVATAEIHADLTSGADVTVAGPLPENSGVAFMADTKGGAFDVPLSVALEWLHQPNPNGRPNSDVLRPWANGRDVTRRARHMWIVDFPSKSRTEVSQYQAPFEHLRMHVYEERQNHRTPILKERWWQHERPRADMRRALAPLRRYLATPEVGKYRPFVWLSPEVLADHQLIVFATDEDYLFGLLHSKVHEVWARAKGSQLREAESGFRYTPTTVFETFPFPETPHLHERVASASRELNRLRNVWTNPSDWLRPETLTFPASLDGPWAHSVTGADANGIGTATYTYLVPVDENAEKALKKRTLTSLYNEFPTWLRDLHSEIDRAVLEGYGLPPGASEQSILAHLLALNLARGGAHSDGRRAHESKR
jgi:hypothetical protein